MKPTSRYQKITKKHVENALCKSGDGTREWKEISNQQDKKTYEYVYMHAFRSDLGKGYGLKVFSSVDKRTNSSRPNGEDCIHICATPVTGGPAIAKAKLYRVAGWENNLRAALSLVASNAHGVLRKYKNRNEVVENFKNVIGGLDTHTCAVIAESLGRRLFELAGRNAQCVTVAITDQSDKRNLQIPIIYEH